MSSNAEKHTLNLFENDLGVDEILSLNILCLIVCQILISKQQEYSKQY